MQSDITTVAQVGCGYWGPNLLRTFSNQPGCRVKWVAELSPARRDYVSRTYPATSPTDDWMTILDDPDVDAAVMATPACTHFALAHSAIQAGKHVFVEKPLAMSTDEVDSLMVAAQLAGRTLMVGHTF